MSKKQKAPMYVLEKSDTVATLRRGNINGVRHQEANHEENKKEMRSRPRQWYWEWKDWMDLRKPRAWLCLLFRARAQSSGDGVDGIDDEVPFQNV